MLVLQFPKSSNYVPRLKVIQVSQCSGRQKGRPPTFIAFITLVASSPAALWLLHSSSVSFALWSSTSWSLTSTITDDFKTELRKNPSPFFREMALGVKLGKLSTSPASTTFEYPSSSDLFFLGGGCWGWTYTPEHRKWTSYAKYSWQIYAQQFEHSQLQCSLTSSNRCSGDLKALNSCESCSGVVSLNWIQRSKLCLFCFSVSLAYARLWGAAAITRVIQAMGLVQTSTTNILREPKIFCISVLNSHPFSLQVATILCLLLNVSSLLLLSILAADGVPSHQGGWL